MTETGIGPAAFRELLGRFATGVTVITTVTGDGSPVGMTANSVSSVSLDPPLVLICVDHENAMHRDLARAAGFVINILASDQEEVSRRFADNCDDRFSGIGYRPGSQGAPILDGVLAYIECHRHSSIEAGDHTIFVGRVTGGAVESGHPLVFYRGGYGELKSP